MTLTRAGAVESEGLKSSSRGVKSKGKEGTWWFLLCWAGKQGEQRGVRLACSDLGGLQSPAVFADQQE